jgi:hypothetical protein
MENGKQPVLDNQFEDNKGLTKREYFAGLAMQGLLSGNAVFQSDIPGNAVRLADKVLAELEKTKTK